MRRKRYPTQKYSPLHTASKASSSREASPTQQASCSNAKDPRPVPTPRNRSACILSSMHPSWGHLARLLQQKIFFFLPMVSPHQPNCAAPIKYLQRMGRPPRWQLYSWFWVSFCHLGPTAALLLSWIHTNAVFLSFTHGLPGSQTFFLRPTLGTSGIFHFLPEICPK